MAEVTATLVVDFNVGDSGGKLIAEIDARPDGFNGGKTSFAPGEQPVYLIFKSAEVVIDSQTPSAGSIAALAPLTGLFAMEEILDFADATEATLQKPVYSGLTAKWLGNSLGTPVLVGDSKLVAPTKGVGVLKVNYNAQFLAYRLTNVPVKLNGETNYHVLIVIKGHS